MNPSHSNVRTAPSEAGPARDSRSIARQSYDDDAHVKDSHSRTRLHAANENVRDSHSNNRLYAANNASPIDSRSMTRVFNDGEVRDGQSLARVGGYSEKDVRSDQERATGRPEDTSNVATKDSNAPRVPHAEELDKDLWKYTFDDPLPQLVQDATAPSHSPSRIYLQSCKLLTLRQYGHWQGRIEISGFWWPLGSKIQKEYRPQPFIVIYSYRQWHSADVSRLICESSDHTLDVVKAVRWTLCGNSSEDEPPVSHWVEEHCQPHTAQLSRPFQKMAKFLGRVRLEDGEGAGEEYCIGEYRLPSKSESLSREEVLRERMPEAASRESESRDYLLL